MRNSSQSNELAYELTLLPVSSLYPHEETLHGILESLKEKIREDREFTEPILVSKDSFIILDGHHRWNAMKDLGFKKIPCIVVDYMNDAIELGTWYPVITRPVNEVLTTFEKWKIPIVEYEGKNEQDIKRFCERRESGGLVCKGDQLLKINEERNVIHRFIREHFLSSLQYFEHWKQACNFAKEKGYVAIISYSFTKKEIVEFAHKGILLPPKATRHILPIKRPLIHVSLSELK